MNVAVQGQAVWVSQALARSCTQHHVPGAGCGQAGRAWCGAGSSGQGSGRCCSRAHRLRVALQLEQGVASLVVCIQHAGVDGDASLSIRCSGAGSGSADIAVVAGVHACVRGFNAAVISAGPNTVW
jgi:hypothetical protein